MRKLFLLGCCTLLLAAPQAAQAQVSFGPQVSYGLDIEEIAVGARLQLGLPTLLTGIQAIGSADYWMVDCGDLDCSTIEVNANLALPLLPIPALNTYFGGGLNYIRAKVEDFDASSETGVNILAGIKFPGTTIRPFAEARYTFGGAEQLTITGGLLFGPR